MLYDKKPMKILKKTLAYRDQQTHALIFIPEGEIKHWSLMTHGYTSHKGSILNWASRLADMKHAVVLFDLPGHYLGNFSEVTDLHHFIHHGHELFLGAYQLLHHELSQRPEHIFTLGHSLGALFAIKALNIDELAKATNISVGLGLLPEGDTHFFLTPLFRKTLIVRSQIVSPALNPEDVFAMIQKEKKLLDVTKKRIHLIAGEDDVVVKGKVGIDNMKTLLENRDNQVTSIVYPRLPHHLPEMATGHLYSFIRDYFK